MPIHLRDPRRSVEAAWEVVEQRASATWKDAHTHGNHDEHNAIKPETGVNRLIRPVQLQPRHPLPQLADLANRQTRHLGCLTNRRTGR